MPKQPGYFVIRNSTSPNSFALSVRKHDSGVDAIYNGIIVQSNQGVYLKCVP